MLLDLPDVPHTERTYVAYEEHKKSSIAEVIFTDFKTRSEIQLQWIEQYLHDGWSNGKGVSFKPSTISACRDLVQFLTKIGATKVDIAPDINGEILVSCRIAGEFVQVYVYSNYTFDLLIEGDNGEYRPIEPNLTLSKVRKALSDFAGMQAACDLSDELTLTITPMENLQTLRSSTIQLHKTQMTTVSPLSPRTALKNLLPHSANTYEISTSQIAIPRYL